MRRIWKLGLVGVCAGLACAGPRGTGQELRAAALEPAPLVAFVVPEPPAPARLQAASPASPRVIGSCDPSAPVARFTLAHLNDLQARYGSLIDGKSRYGFVAGYLRKLKADVPATLVLDAGDDYEKGSIAELRSNGESTRQMIQALPIDARTIGNHDFAYGEEALLRDVRGSAHPVLAANVRYANGESPFAPFIRIDVGCVKVGIVGLVTGNYGADDQPSREPFDGVFAQDDHYAKILAAEVRAHRNEVDVMIALDHLGLWEDIGLAAKVPGVDLAVGGHSEDTLRDPYWVARKDGTHAWVLQAGHWAEALGRADLAYSARDKRLSFDRYAIVKVDSSLPYAADVGALAARLEEEHAPDAHRAIATLRRDVPAGKGMADLVFRAVEGVWGADALVVGKDLFWDKLRAGPVTLQGLYDTTFVQRQPAGTSGFSSLHEIDVTGAQLRAMREKLRSGPVYAFYGPERITMDRTYRVIIEKRALEIPKLAFLPGLAPLPEGTFKGEMIDALEAYARSRAAAGLSLD